MPLESRNKTVGFASRTLKNLKHIKEARYVDKADVHVGTQLVSSLLGLTVLPYERDYEGGIQDATLKELDRQGWYMWKLTKVCDKKHGLTLTLKLFIYHIRNAVAHGRFMFSSDSLLLSEWSLTVRDGPKGGPINWEATIGGKELYCFCRTFAQYLDTPVKDTERTW